MHIAIAEVALQALGAMAQGQGAALLRVCVAVWARGARQAAAQRATEDVKRLTDQLVGTVAVLPSYDEPAAMTVPAVVSSR